MKNRIKIIIVVAIAVAVSLAYLSPNFNIRPEVSAQAANANPTTNCNSVDVREPLETNVLRVRSTFKTVIAEKEIFNCVVGTDPSIRTAKEVTLVIETLETNTARAGTIPVFETKKSVEVILCVKNLDPISSTAATIPPLSVPCAQYSPPNRISGTILGCSVPVVLDDPIDMASATIDSNRKTATGTIKQTIVKTVIVEKEIITCDVEERDSNNNIIRTGKDFFDVFTIEEIIEQAIEPNPPVVVAKYFESVTCQKDTTGRVLGCIVTQPLPIPAGGATEPNYFDGQFL